jgi:hypothetical protein
MTVFHSIAQVGYLTTDAFSLWQSPNLIPNPSVETAGTGGNPANWFRGGSGSNTRAFTYPVAGEEGAKAVKVEVSGYVNGTAKWYFSDVPVSAGKVYAFSDSYQSNAQSFVGARFRKPDGTYTYGNSIYYAASPSGWNITQRAITVPAGITSMTVYHGLAQNGTLTTDDASLTLVSP